MQNNLSAKNATPALFFPHAPLSICAQFLHYHRSISKTNKEVL